jgi:UDP-N-acetylglucosamine 2-epimerase (non-hydrolysing)/GDP/UDP-N,N'-diacetylbacillosamine 2-epimerase (hydrolysing)
MRKIAVFTGNRAEYGLQFPLLKAIKEHPNLDYQLIVSGAHLDNDFGRTIDEISKDGFEIHAEVKIEMDQDTTTATAQAISTGISSMSQVLERLKPDVLVVYADRFEGFAGVIAGTQMNIPTAHIEGGDITEGGALDDSVRHAMTKLSHFHFTTNEQATQRVLAMGEEAWRVHTVGFPAIDMIQEGNYATPAELVEIYGLDLQRPVVLFTQHSVTTESSQSREQVTPSLEAMRRLAEEGVQVILTYPNNDAGGRSIIQELEKFSSLDCPNIQLHKSLGRYNYHGVLALALVEGNEIVCVGNSSSGIKETPAFNCPCVDIGSRQMGRLRAANVLHSEYDAEEIYTLTKKCFDSEFIAQCRSIKNPYGVGDAGKKIASVLASEDFNLTRILRKKMTI